MLFRSRKSVERGEGLSHGWMDVGATASDVFRSCFDHPSIDGSIQLYSRTTSSSCSCTSLISFGKPSAVARLRRRRRRRVSKPLTAGRDRKNETERAHTNQPQVDARAGRGRRKLVAHTHAGRRTDGDEPASQRSPLCVLCVPGFRPATSQPASALSV